MLPEHSDTHTSCRRWSDSCACMQEHTHMHTQTVIMRARAHTHTTRRLWSDTLMHTHAHTDCGGGAPPRSEVHLPTGCCLLSAPSCRSMQCPGFSSPQCSDVLVVTVSALWPRQTRPVGRLCDRGAAAQDTESRSPERRSKWHRTHCVLTQSWTGPGKAQRPVPVGGPASLQTQCSRQGAPCLTQRTQGHLGGAWAAAA